jgi:subtilisin family serine protease
VTYAVAAGNSNSNASGFSPARVGEAITVGSSTRTDARSSFSNFGSVVDVFAPGSSIQSAWHTSDTATATLSGTSMASPHAAGVAARVLQGSPTASPASVRNTIVNAATTNRLSGIPSGTANRLLFRSGTQ